MIRYKNERHNSALIEMSQEEHYRVLASSLADQDEEISSLIWTIARQAEYYSPPEVHRGRLIIAPRVYLCHHSLRFECYLMW